MDVAFGLVGIVGGSGVGATASAPLGSLVGTAEIQFEIKKGPDGGSGPKALGNGGVSSREDALSLAPQG